jgi:hypothetical protein
MTKKATTKASTPSKDTAATKAAPTTPEDIKPTTPADIANTTEAETEARNVVDEVDVESAFAQAAANPKPANQPPAPPSAEERRAVHEEADAEEAEGGDEEDPVAGDSENDTDPPGTRTEKPLAPLNRGPARAGADVTPSRADKNRAAAGSGKGSNAETAAKAYALRERARATEVEKEAKGEGKAQGDTRTVEEVAKQAAEDARKAAEDREARRHRKETGEPRPRTEKPDQDDDPEVRLAEPIARIKTLAEDGSRGARDELRGLQSRYSTLSQKRYKDQSASPVESAEEYHVRNAKHKAAHIRDAADMALLAAKAAAALRQVENERRSNG